MTPRGGHSFRVAVAIAVLAVQAACAGRPGPVRVPTLQEALANPDHHEQLRRDLRAIFSSRTVDHGLWSVAVHSLKRGETLYSSNAFRLQLPASNQKVLTTAVAAERLGWDYRYTTKVYATAAISGGAIDGDLIIESNGDPTINPRHQLRQAAFDDWAKQLAAKGIQVINGRLIGDDNAFAEPGWGLGWSWDDFAYGYGAPVSALQYNENQVELSISPGPGGRAEIAVSPAGSGLTIDNQVVTTADGTTSSITLERVPGTHVLTVRGTVAAGGAPVRETAAVPNPTLFYLNAVREALARQGVVVKGEAVDIDDLDAPPERSQTILLIEDRSTSLLEIIDVTNKWSRNLYAETLLRSLSPAGQPATSAAGLVVLRETLRSWGISGDYFLARDGSGLSRYDFLTPDASIGVLTYVWLDPELDEGFRSSLPVMGVSGSLAERLRGTPAQARVWAKTGSMSQVRSLSGYVVTAEGEPLVFSFMVTGFRVPVREIDTAMDLALLRLVAFEHPSLLP